MEDFIKQICRIIGQILSFVYPYKISHLLQIANRYIKTGYYARRFASLGKYSCMNTPSTLVGLKYIHIGNNTRMGKSIRLIAIPSTMNKTETPLIVVGDNCTFGVDNQISSSYGVTIGNNLLTGSNVTITDHAHGASSFEDAVLPPNERKLVSKGKVMIGNNVWIGSNVVILPNVEIGDGCIIGANTVIAKSMPPYSVAVGTEGRIVKRIQNDSNT